MQDQDKIVINGQFPKFLRNYWILVVFIGGLIVAWANIQSSIKDHEKRVTKLEIQYENALKDLQSLKETMIQIKTIVELIQTNTKQ
jgi:hypothetical protein